MSILVGLLLFVPVFVLGAAIGWPASLDEPATTVMPMILDQEVSVRIGYLIYLAYSVLFFPVVALVGRVIGDTPVTRVATVFAAMSALARSIGIIRWLSVLPAIAAAFATSPDVALPAVFDAINSFGGAIGELLGVSLFAAASIGLTSWAILRSSALPSWLGAFGLVVTAALLLPWLEIFGLDLGAVITVSTSLLQLWFLALVVRLLLSARRADERATSAR